MLTLFKGKKKEISVGMQVSSGALSLLLLDEKEPQTSSLLRYSVHDYLTYAVNNEFDVAGVLPTIQEDLQAKKVSDANCCFVLDDKDYQILTIESPNVPLDELREAVRWKIKDLIQLPIDEIAIDVFLLPNSEETNKAFVNVVVVHNSIIKKVSRLVSDVGLNLVAIDIPELCYRNYLEYSEYHEKSVALVLVKENYGKLMVIKKGNVLFSRSFSIDYNGGLFDELPGSDIVLELQRSLDYYESQLKQVAPSLVIVVGENINEEKVTASIKESLYQEVILGDVEGECISDEHRLSSGRLMATYGAALRSRVGV